MTRDEAKQLLPIIEAFSEGKTIQWLNDEGGWENIPKNEDMDFEDIAGFTGSYRIKPSPKCRPFANAEECMMEILKHQPFLKYKCGSICRDVYLSIVKIKLDGIETDDGRYEFNDAMDKFTFADGSVFGVKEESEE